MKKTFSRLINVTALALVMTAGFSTDLAAQNAQQSNPFQVNNVYISAGKSFDISQLNASATIELSEEEQKFLDMQLLPYYYPVLKRCAEGKEPFTGKDGGLTAAKNLCKSFYPQGKGNYSRDFGNPVRMLDWAKRWHKDEKMVKMVTSAKRGDIFLNGPKDKQAIDKNFICLMTKGPYYHATMVVDSVPPIIIEAVGITANKSDTTSDKVRMSTWYEEMGDWCNYRLVRPTHGLPASQANAIIEKAIGYAEAQLGKPYDYSFSNSDGDRAFYCSELVSKAYFDGAGFKGNIAQKDPERDKIIVALHSVIDGLEPKNKYQLADKVMNFAVAYSHSPDINKLQEFIINDLVPDCKTLDKAFPGPEGRAKLNKVFNKIKSNEGFKSFTAANKSYEDDKKAGKFNAGWGIGKLRELKSKASVGLSLLKDIDRLGKETGASRKDLTMVVMKLFIPVYQNLGTFGEVLGGMDKTDQVSLPEGVKTVLKIVDWGVSKRESVKNWPVIGGTLAKLMPGNGDGKIFTDLTSPSDLAQASPGFTIDYP